MMKKLTIIFLAITIFTSFKLSAQDPEYYNYNTAGSPNFFPWGWSAGKEVQLLYLAGDFNQPSPAPIGNIISISFLLYSPIVSTQYVDLTIKLGQSTITSFTPGSFYSPLTTVYHREYITLSGDANQWMTITLDSTFLYDPTQSLIVDVGQCYIYGGGSNAKSSFTMLTGNRRIYSTDGCPFDYFAEDERIYHVGLTIAEFAVTTAATSVTSTTASLNGTFNANGDSTTITFEYGLTNAYGTSIPGIPGIVTGDTNMPVTASITGLLPDSTYHYRIHGVNSYDTLIGADMTFKTLVLPTITGPTPVCEGSTGNVYTTEAGYSGYIWAVSAGGSITAGGNGSDSVVVTWNTAGAQAVIVNYTNEIGYAPYFTIYPVLVTSLPPPAINLTNIIVASGQELCYDANQTITVGGAGPFLVQTGAAVNLIAGQKIELLQGTKVEQGGYLKTSIVSNCLWCNAYPMNQMVAVQPDTKSRWTIDNPLIDKSNNRLFKIYPNPRTGTVTLELFDVTETTAVRDEIYGMRGGNILKKELNGVKTYQFSLSEHPGSLYFINVIDGKRFESIKVIHK